MNVTCAVNNGHTISMNESPRLSMGAQTMTSPLSEEIARPRTISASMMIQITLTVNETHRFRQQSSTNFTSYSTTRINITIRSKLNSNEPFSLYSCSYNSKITMAAMIPEER